MNRLNSKSSGKLPGKQQNVSTVTLRSDKKLPSITPPPVATPIPSPVAIPVEENDKEATQREIPPPPITQVSTSSSPLSSIITKAHFPNRLARPKKDVMDDEISQTFR